MFFLISVFGIAADLYTKYLVEQSMALGEVRKVIPPLLDLAHIRNYGAAWSILQNKVNFLLIFTGIMLAGLVFYYFKYLKNGSIAEKIGIAMIFAGGCGNFYSRITVGFVTDFLDIHIIPVFNVADVFVTCGCFLILIYYFFFSKEEEKGENAASDAGGSTDDGK